MQGFSLADLAARSLLSQPIFCCFFLGGRGICCLTNQPVFRRSPSEHCSSNVRTQIDAQKPFEYFNYWKQSKPSVRTWRSVDFYVAVFKTCMLRWKLTFSDPNNFSFSSTCQPLLHPVEITNEKNRDKRKTTQLFLFPLWFRHSRTQTITQRTFQRRKMSMESPAKLRYSANSTPQTNSEIRRFEAVLPIATQSNNTSGLCLYCPNRLPGPETWPTSVSCSMGRAEQTTCSLVQSTYLDSTQRSQLTLWILNLCGPSVDWALKPVGVARCAARILRLDPHFHQQLRQN